MDDILLRLLDAEARAQAQVDEATARREAIIAAALEAAAGDERQFQAHLDDLRAPYLRQATERADQAIGELNKRFEERCRHLRALAAKHEADAVAAALAILLGTGEP